MTEREVAEAVAAWAAEVLDDVETTYAYPVASKLGALPDAAAWVQRVIEAPSDERFPYRALEQLWVRVFEVELSLQAEVIAEDDETTPAALEASAKAAHDQLADFAPLLREALRDASLGGRLTSPVMASPQAVYDYSTPFVVHEDGTRGRFLRLELAICEPIPDPRNG